LDFSLVLLADIMSFLGAHECCRISGLDSTVSQDTISLVFCWIGLVGFRRIGICVGFSGSGSGWFFVGSDSVGFSGSGYSVFCRIGLGFSSLDLRFF